MKKILIISNLAWASLFLLMSFSNLSKNNIANEKNDTYIKGGTSIGSSCGKDGFKGLTLNQLLWGIARYRQTRWDSINALQYMQKNQIQDARSCWYSLDTLKKYICFIEQYANTLHIPADSLGIRLYYAVYSNKVGWYQEYESHHTLFIVPTFKYTYATAQKGASGVSDANIDFDPRYSVKNKISGDQNPHRYTFQEIYERGDVDLNVFCLDASTANNDTGNNKNRNEMISVASKNEGQLCPPTCIPPIKPSVITKSKEIFSYASWHASSDTVQNLLQFIDAKWPKGISWKDPK